MWELLPIQTSGIAGQPFTVIQPNFPYPRSSDVRVLIWKDVPTDIQQWAQSIWEDIFECVRSPISPDDLFAWIPGVGILYATSSRWTDTDRSFRVAFVHHIYVHPGNRHRGTVPKLVCSLCHEVVSQWNIQVFAFELEQVPPSLSRKRAIPFLSFDYVWIPFFPTEDPWILLNPTETKKYLTKQQGFHSRYTGWQVYEHPQNRNRVVLDAHNDIVHCDSFQSVVRCHIPGMRGAYIRLFHPLGNNHIFVENLFFPFTRSGDKLA